MKLALLIDITSADSVQVHEKDDEPNPELEVKHDCLQDIGAVRNLTDVLKQCHASAHQPPDRRQSTTRTAGPRKLRSSGRV